MKTTERLNLRNVTICAADSVNPALAARALDISMSQCEFGDAILFAHEEVPTRARIEPIVRLQSAVAYSSFMLKDLVRYVSTPWVLVVQWDGYIVDASQWRDAFFEYDYIGAVWPHREKGEQVGNGGFSLRSARLLDALASERFAVPPNAVEDELICCRYRPVLEAEFGIRFGPEAIANRFSYEIVTPDRPTLGFHGLFNMWRYVDDDAMMAMLQTLDTRTLVSAASLGLFLNYLQLRKFSCAKALYEIYRSHWSAPEIVDRLMRNGLPDAVAQHWVDICEDA